VYLARTGSPVGIIPGPPCRAGYEDSTFGTETIISSIASDDAVETRGDVVESRNGGMVLINLRQRGWLFVSSCSRRPRRVSEPFRAKPEFIPFDYIPQIL
jgi:hypothetical protein